LIEYYDGLLLLDGCCRSDIIVLKEFITYNLARPLTDLKLVVVTHLHPDHAGAATKLRTLTGCKIASANMPTQWYRGVSGGLCI
jgi:glyoxylase-like metal-dependent hydrolase (beta-lactamase superfamily II)